MSSKKVAVKAKPRLNPEALKAKASVEYSRKKLAEARESVASLTVKLEKAEKDLEVAEAALKAAVQYYVTVDPAAREKV
jgi:hypothetical protein